VQLPVDKWHINFLKKKNKKKTDRQRNEAK
jgi:hypothetical protein